MISRSRAGFTLNIIDTPGLIEGGYVNDQTLDIIKRLVCTLPCLAKPLSGSNNVVFAMVTFSLCLGVSSSFLLDRTIDVLLYVDRLDAYRVDNLDKQVIKAITDSFGKEIWRRALVVLTHAQLSPPDGLEVGEAGLVMGMNKAGKIGEDWWGFKLVLSYPRREIVWGSAKKLGDVEGLKGGAQLIVELVENVKATNGKGKEKARRSEDNEKVDDEYDGYDTEESE